MIIDLTTHNNIYNTVGSQAQWFQHRWGSRPYKEASLTLGQAKRAIVSGTGPLRLSSVYGDALCWEPLEQLLNEVDFLMIHTYGMGTIPKNVPASQTFVFEVDGWGDHTGKIFLGAKFRTIRDNVMQSPNKYIEFSAYEHNLTDIPDLIQFCIRNNIAVKITNGLATLDGISPVITSEGDWLYDVVPAGIESDWLTTDESKLALLESLPDFREVECRRHLETYSALRTFLPYKSGRNIHNYPMLSTQDLDKKIEQRVAEAISREDNVCITPTGYRFHSTELYLVYMLMLGSDWTLKRSDMSRYTTNDYYIEALCFARHLAKLDYTQIEV